MAEIVKMPKLSDTMEEGVVAEWHKKVGDSVESGDLLAEIETDKATMEFESFQDGVLLHIGVEKGDAAPVDSVLCILGEKDEDISGLLDGNSGGSSEKKEGKGEKEEKDDKEESDDKEKAKKKTEDDGSSTDDEKSEKKKEADPDDAKSEKKEEKSTGKSDSSKEEKQESEPQRKGDTNGRVIASPLAKSLASDKGIDIREVKGTGDGGRIVKKDIENYTPAAASKSAPSTGGQAGKESYTDEPVSQMRKAIAKTLSGSKFSAPHFYLTIEIDMENAMASRKAINEAIAPDKISVNDMVLKSAAMALKKHPKVNSDWLGDKLRRNDHVHIGVAVAVEEGLLVPVVRFTDTKPMVQINKEVKEFAEKARNKKLQPADWEGSTFTISNLGMFGIDEFTAIIYPPNACIMAVGTIVEKPVVKNGLIVVGHTMKVTLSCDHRIVDGAVGSAFLQTFQKYLENPVMMLAQ